MTPNFAAKRQLSQSALRRSTDGVSHGVQFDPTPTLDGPGGHWARKRSFPLLRGSDFRSLKVFLGFEVGTGPPPRAFCCRPTKATPYARSSRTPACVCVLFGNVSRYGGDHVVCR